MLQQIRCHVCGKVKVWHSKPPFWYTRKILDPNVIESPKPIYKKIQICSKKCLTKFKEK